MGAVCTKQTSVEVEHFDPTSLSSITKNLERPIMRGDWVLLLSYLDNLEVLAWDPEVAPPAEVQEAVGRVSSAAQLVQDYINKSTDPISLDLRQVVFKFAELPFDFSQAIHVPRPVFSFETLSAKWIEFPNEFANLVERIQNEEDFRQKLLDVVMKSREDQSDQAKMAASNALTLLAYSRFEFVDLDLSGICAPQAILSHSKFLRCNLKDAILTLCDFSSSVMTDCDLTGASLESISTGFYPTKTFENPVQVVALVKGKNGELLACSDGSTVHLYEFERGLLKSLIKDFGHNGTVSCLAFSAHGEFLATVCDDLTIRIWDMATLAEIKSLPGHSHPITCMSFSRDGKWLASGESGPFTGIIYIWNLETGSQVHQLDPFNGIVGVDFTLDSKVLMNTGNDSTVHFWDVETGKEIRKIPGWGYSGPCKVLPDGKLAAFATTTDNCIHFCYVDNAQEDTRRMLGHVELVKSFDVSSGGWLVSACTDGSVQLWNHESNPQDYVKAYFHNTVCSVALSSDGKFIVSVGEDGTMQIVPASGGDGNDLDWKGSKVSVGLVPSAQKEFLTEHGALLE